MNMVVVAAACLMAEPVRASAAQDAPARAVAAQAVDASPARAFREMRAAELAAGDAAVDAAKAICPGADADARARLAHDAIARRARAGAGAELASAEDALADARAELAVGLAPRDAACARELLLECAEDLLLRRLVADGSDAAIAIGLPTAAERDAARGAIERAERALRSPLLADAWTAAPSAASAATDPVVFRANLLAGLAAAARADLAACAGAGDAAAASRAEAARLLAVAARSELPVPAEMASVLALARARTTDDAALRTRLLTEARKTRDPARNLVARCEEWRMAGADTAFPTTDAAGDRALALLAMFAEARARADRGEPSAAVCAPFARAFVQARAAGGDDAARVQAIQRLAATIAPRLGARMRELAAEQDAPPLLVALAATAPGADAQLAQRADALVRASADPAIAPWLGIPLARALQTVGRTQDAARVLLHFVEHAAAADDAREAFDIALAIRRTAAAGDASGEIALDEALALAARAFATDAARDAWALERVDLALHPRWNRRDPERAAELLRTVSTRAEIRSARDLRAAEIDAARLLASTSPDAGDALRNARRAESIASGLGPGEHALVARCETLRAEMLLAAARPAEALACATQALGEPGLDDQTAQRAVAAWFRASAEKDGAGDPPAALAALAARNPAVREIVERELAEETLRVEELLVDGDAAKARTAARSRLASIARVAPAATAQATRAAVLGEMLCAETPEARAEATAHAERATKRWPSDRALRWILAESLRSQGATDATLRARAFATMRELAPLATRERDAFWWRAQLGQLELLAEDPTHAGEIAARINRLAALDPALGGAATARRFNALRERCASAVKPTRDEAKP